MYDNIRNSKLNYEQTR
jgi:hypothetical protein